jgi:hypothetical protein
MLKRQREGTAEGKYGRKPSEEGGRRIVATCAGHERNRDCRTTWDWSGQHLPGIDGNEGWMLGNYQA